MSSPAQTNSSEIARRGARPERRRARRLAVIESGLVAVTLDQHNGGILLDVSDSGVCVQAVSPMATGAATALEFSIPETQARLVVSGAVRWSDGSGRTGIAFRQPPSAASALRDWLQRLADAHAFSSEPVVEDPLGRVAEAIRRRMDADGVAIALGDRDAMTCRASTGSAPPVGVALDPSSGLSGECVRTGRPVRCEDSQADPRVDAEVCRRINLRSAILVPVLDGAKVAGVLEAFFSAPRSFTPADVRELESIAREIAQIAGYAAPTARSQPVPASGTLGAAAAPARAPEPPAPPAAALPGRPRPAWNGRLAVPRSFTDLGLANPDLRQQRIGIVVGIAFLVLAVGAAIWFRPQPRPQTQPQPQETAAPVTLPPAPGPAPATSVTPERPPATPALKPAVAAAAKPVVEEPKLAEPLSLLDRELPAPIEAQPPVIAAQAPDDVSSVLATTAEVPRLLDPVSTGLVPGRILHRVQPAYPAAARAARLGGAVRLRAVVRPDGSIGAVQVDDGNPILAKAALAAVRQWRYEPYRLNGQPISIEVEITIHFRRP